MLRNPVYIHTARSNREVRFWVPFFLENLLFFSAREQKALTQKKMYIFWRKNLIIQFFKMNDNCRQWPEKMLSTRSTSSVSKCWSSFGDSSSICLLALSVVTTTTFWLIWTDYTARSRIVASWCCYVDNLNFQVAFGPTTSFDFHCHFSQYSDQSAKGLVTTYHI